MSDSAEQQQQLILWAAVVSAEQRTGSQVIAPAQEQIMDLPRGAGKKNEDKSFGEEKSTTGGNQDVSVVSTRNFNVNSNDLNLFFSAGQ